MKSNMEVWPVSIEKLDNGKSLNISFDDKSEFKISAELLRVECPSADVQGHGGPKIIVKNKKNILINKIEEVGNYAIRITFLMTTAQVFLVGIYYMILGKIKKNI